MSADAKLASGVTLDNSQSCGMQGSARLASSVFLLRVTGVPVAMLESLAVPETAALLGAALDAEETLLAQREGISATLAHAVPVASAGSSRTSVLNVRRGLFNLRLPAEDDIERASAYLSSEDGRAIRLFRDAVSRYRTGLAELPLLLEREMVKVRTRLRPWISDEDFLSGLTVASPTLHDEVGRCLAANARGQGQRLRKLEGGLIRYLVRAATKTTPFSRLTPLARGDWSASGQFLRPGRGLDALTKEAWVQLSVGWLATLEHFLATQRGSRDAMPVQRNPALFSRDGRTAFLRRKPSGRTGGIIQNSESVMTLGAESTRRSAARGTFARRADAIRRTGSRGLSRHRRVSRRGFRVD